MGWLTDKLRAKLSKQRKKKVQVKFKSAPFKDITFLPSTSTELELSNHVNNRLNVLVAKAGGASKFSETDFTILFIDKLSPHNMVQEYELQKKVARDVSSGIDTHDWEPKTVDTVLKAGTSLATSQFFIIIIEYTIMQEKA